MADHGLPDPHVDIIGRATLPLRREPGARGEGDRTGPEQSSTAHGIAFRRVQHSIPSAETLDIDMPDGDRWFRPVTPFERGTYFSYSGVSAERAGAGEGVGRVGAGPQQGAGGR